MSQFYNWYFQSIFNVHFKIILVETNVLSWKAADDTTSQCCWREAFIRVLLLFFLRNRYKLPYFKQILIRGSKWPHVFHLLLQQINKNTLLHKRFNFRQHLLKIKLTIKVNQTTQTVATFGAHQNLLLSEAFLIPSLALEPSLSLHPETSSISHIWFDSCHALWGYYCRDESLTSSLTTVSMFLQKLPQTQHSDSQNILGHHSYIYWLNPELQWIYDDFWSKRLLSSSNYLIIFTDCCFNYMNIPRTAIKFAF